MVYLIITIRLHRKLTLQKSVFQDCRLFITEQKLFSEIRNFSYDKTNKLECYMFAATFHTPQGCNLPLLLFNLFIITLKETILHSMQMIAPEDCYPNGIKC